jgi:hypothetical protein
MTSKSRSYNAKPTSSRKHIEEFVDPKFWNPKSPNFVIMDWDKWYAKNPTVPKVYNPPQRNQLKGILSVPIYWWARSWLGQPLGFCYRPCSPKPEMERISDVESGALVTKLLGAHPNSEVIPEAFRNKLLWTKDNNAPETLISFNRWAWRSQSREGRVVGLGHLRDDWTNDTSCFGLFFATGQNSKYATVQVSPDKKWILLNTFSNPDDETKKCNCLYFYVVQEEDEFTTPDGKVIDYLKPGDLVRVTWNRKDAYECDNELLSYMYYPRVVATLDEEKGTVDLDEENYADLLEKATNKPGCGMCVQTCCFTCSCFMSPEERFDFNHTNLSDMQILNSGTTPPEGEAIERL